MATNALAENKYYRADLTKVKATNRGGRLYSAVYEGKDLFNGTLGYLGDYVAGSTEIMEFKAPTAELIKNKMPVIVMKPEIVYDERFKKLGDFVNPAGKALPVVPLEEFDGIDLSADYFDLAGKATGKKTEIEVGDMFAIQPDIDVVGSQLKYSTSKPAVAQNACYFRVIGIKNSHIATYLYTDGTADMMRFPKPYKLVALEVVKPIA